ncbi:MAG: SagB/ThcOx family dehydrogenase, partial [Candidatus Omnitrophica bacterium]|nr:SagB/ThcOx family dehydrogenase [Candidatus Omnitrophota bacterium]
MKVFTFVLSAMMLFFCLAPAQALDYGKIELPPPQTDGGMPLMRALKQRQSRREFSDKELSLQDLSNLLWAAFGINRADSGGRTAPSAHNAQEIDIYVAVKGGLFLYDARNHMLEPVLPEDIRPATGQQPFVKNAPVNLIFVAD